MLLELRKFVVPEFVYGLGAIKLAGQYAKNYGAKKVLVVTDAEIINAGWIEPVAASLEKFNLSYEIFSHITPNPKAAEVLNGALVYQDAGCDAIVAVGGGSSIDCAKGIGIVSANNKHIFEFEGIDKIIQPLPPLICIPTTAGSSADVSQFAIIMDEELRVKKTIVSKILVPDVSLIDPQTLTTMPAYLTACTGMDALTHAIEAYVSNASSPITDNFALEAIRLISLYLPGTIKQPDNIELRGKMMLASLQAGIAFSNAILGAVHAMAHSLGGYLDLPHGECNAVLLNHVIEYNYSACPERYWKIGEAMDLNFTGMSDNEKLNALLEKIKRLKGAVGITRTLTDLGVTSDDIPHLAANTMNDACMATNPRTLTQKHVEVIFKNAL